MSALLITTLTKRYGRELSEYLNEHGVLKFVNLHSGYDTVERMKLFRITHSRKFDVFSRL